MWGDRGLGRRVRGFPHSIGRAHGSVASCHLKPRSGAGVIRAAAGRHAGTPHASVGAMTGLHKLEFRRPTRQHRGKNFYAELVISTDSAPMGQINEFCVTECSIVYVKCAARALSVLPVASAECRAPPSPLLVQRILSAVGRLVRFQCTCAPSVRERAKCLQPAHGTPPLVPCEPQCRCWPQAVCGHRARDVHGGELQENRSSVVCTSPLPRLVVTCAPRLRRRCCTLEERGVAPHR